MRYIVSVDENSKELPKDVSMSPDSTLNRQVKQIINDESYLSFDNRSGVRVLTKDPDDPSRSITIHAETGIRDIKREWESSYNIDNTLGTVFITREKNTVTLFLSTMKLKSEVGVSYTLPDGFKPYAEQLISTSAFTTSMGEKVSLVIPDNRNVYLSMDIHSPEEYVYGQISWFTNDDWPTSLPGVPLI